MSQNTIDIKKEIVMKGIYTFTRANIETDAQRSLLAVIDYRKKAGQPFMELVRKLNAMCRTEKFVYKNIVPTVCRTMIANNLTSGSPTNVMQITDCALGSSATTPANADTQLGTEVYRNAIASLTNSNNVAYATGFFSATETTGTYAECGIFSNGTATANSGILISHVLISLTKTNTQTLTLDWTLTLS